MNHSSTVLLIATLFVALWNSHAQLPLPVGFSELETLTTAPKEKEVVVVNVTNGLHRSNAKKAMKLISDLDPARTEALIVQIHCLMDTNWDELNLVMSGLGRLNIPTYAFVDSMAVDAGALLAFATDHIYMAPASIIGGSPILGDGNMRAKRESFNLATARAVAMSKGRDPDLVEAIWNADREVKWNGKLLAKEGETLMIEAQDAVMEDDEGNRFLAKALVRDVYELGKHAGLESKFRFTNAIDPKLDDKGKPMNALKSKEVSFKDRIVVLEIGKSDLVNSARFDYMRRVLKRAQQEKASAVILDLNTPGGLAWQTGELMMRSLGKLDVPTYAYVNPSAVSAGALIALAADHIYMSPVSAIGAAAVVTPFGDLEEDVEKKINSILVPLCRSVARSKGHDPVYATKFMVTESASDTDGDGKSDDTSLEVEKQEDGTFKLKINESDEAASLLSLAATEATEEWKGAAPLAKGIASSLQDLIEKENLEGEIIIAEPLGFELMAQWITRFSALLLLAAFIAAQVELRVPGFGLFGFLSLGLFGLFFFGHYAAGKLVGFEMVALFILGIALVIAEFIFFPGTLIVGLLGFLCVITALVFTMADAKVLPSGELSPWLVETASLGDSLWNLSLALVGAVVVALLSARFFPESRLFKKLVLESTAAPSGTGLKAPIAEPNAVEAAVDTPESPTLVGKRGRALTPLRPSGTALVGDEPVDVVTDGTFLDAETEIEVTLVEGSRIVVRAIESTPEGL